MYNEGACMETVRLSVRPSVVWSRKQFDSLTWKFLFFFPPVKTQKLGFEVNCCMSFWNPDAKKRGEFISCHNFDGKLLPTFFFIYISAPVIAGNRFQDLPRLREIGDNVKRYYSVPGKSLWTYKSVPQLK
jgi:hypothetical protein